MTTGSRFTVYGGVGTVLVVLALLGSTGCPSARLALDEAKLLIEHNATDEDTGFQGFADGEPWNELTITGPGAEQVLHVEAAGGLFDFGLTELFFETSEPPNDEVPIEEVLDRLPEGDYRFRGDIIGALDRSIKASLVYDIPAGPVLLTPADGATGLDPNNVVVSWEAVSQDINGSDIDIVGYEVVVEEEAEPLFPQSFARPVLSVHVPASVTSVTVPAEFLQTDACYQYEVLAIEETGNQTISSATFETGAGCEGEAAKGVPVSALTEAKLLIEHNATDGDTGFQGFADGEPWSRLTITGPDDETILTVDAEGELSDFGLTELFFETSEPPNDEVPIEDVLAHLPEGTYTFTGETVDDGETTRTATLTHDIPAGPVLVSPTDGATDVDPADVVVAWQAVTTDINGSPGITIVGYQVIVELDEEPAFPQGFAHPVFSVFLPASATSVTVPAEFFESDAPYEVEVLAIEESGNQTISAVTFSTE